MICAENTLIRTCDEYSRPSPISISIDEKFHVQQQYNWDCGIACVAMILKACGQTPAWDDLIHSVGTESVWTIDLAILLHNRSIKFLFITKLAGVEQNHGHFTFYKDHFDNDSVRVSNLFHQASACSMPIQEASIGEEKLIKLAKSNHIAVILLVNFKILDPQSPDQSSSCVASRESYQGHYIILCGFDDVREVFMYRDPAKPEGVFLVSKQRLHFARISHGTDEDLLVIDLKSSREESTKIHHDQENEKNRRDEHVSTPRTQARHSLQIILFNNFIQEKINTLKTFVTQKS